MKKWGKKIYIERVYPYPAISDYAYILLTSIINFCQLNPNQKNFILTFNPVPDMPNLGSSNSTANKDVVSKEGTDEDTII